MLEWGAWEWLGAAANILQVVSAVVVAAVFVKSYQDVRAYRRARETAGTERPWAMVVGRDDYSGQVESYLRDSGQSMDMGDPIVFGTLTTREMRTKVLHRVLEQKRKLTNCGATEVHLFYGGPVSIAIGIGAILDNWVPVLVYELGKDGHYVPSIALDKETVKGLERHDVIRPHVRDLVDHL